jgi:hypothetical protein
VGVLEVPNSERASLRRLLVVRGAESMNRHLVKDWAFILMTGALLLLGCGSGKHTELDSDRDRRAVVLPTEEEDREAAQITLVRAQCGGGYCPNYTLIIRSTGQVTYLGRSHVRVTGVQDTTIPKEVVRSLLRHFEEAGFFELADQYQSGARDCATAYLTQRIGDRTKTVENYWCDLPQPSKEVEKWREQRSLNRLAELVDEAVHVDQWIGTEIERRELRKNWKMGRAGQTENVPK